MYSVVFPVFGLHTPPHPSRALPIAPYTSPSLPRPSHRLIHLPIPPAPFSSPNTLPYYSRALLIASYTSPSLPRLSYRLIHHPITTAPFLSPYSHPHPSRGSKHNPLDNKYDAFIRAIKILENIITNNSLRRLQPTSLD